MLHKNRVFTRLGQWLDEGRAVVFACVVDTAGSTYSKPGDFIVIADNGDYQGLVSGGCVEGDLAQRAAQCLQERRVLRVSYDLGGEHDALWGMGAGCDGTLDIWLLPIADPDSAAPLLLVKQAYEAGRLSAFALPDPVQEQRVPLLIACQASTGASAPDERHALLARRLAAGEAGNFTTANGQRWFSIIVMPAPRVLILGAAPDAEPLCQLLAAIGWSATVYDHRPAYIDAAVGWPTETAHCAPAAALTETLALSAFDAVVIMSHHLASDECYLEAVAAQDHWHYIGVLGPQHRRQRLIDSIGGVDATIESRLHGPAGLDIGGREPASIALSIVAEMQQVLSTRGRV